MKTSIKYFLHLGILLYNIFGKANHIKSFVHGHFKCNSHDAGGNDYLINFQKLEECLLYVNTFVMIRQCSVQKECIVFSIDLILFILRF